MKLKAGLAGFLLSPVFICLLISCQSDAEVEFQRYYSNGGAIYHTRCENCHGAHGEGLQTLIPPLNDTGYIRANKPALACDVKNGIKGKIVLSNRTFEGEMPGNELPTVELAAVLTYISNTFGNKAGIIRSEQVEKDLKNCP